MTHEHLNNSLAGARSFDLQKVVYKNGLPSWIPEFLRVEEIRLLRNGLGFSEAVKEAKAQRAFWDDRHGGERIDFRVVPSKLR